MIHAVRWLNACLLIGTSHVEGTGVAIKMTTKPAERNQCVSSVTWSHLQRAWHEKGAIKKQSSHNKPPEGFSEAQLLRI